MKKHGKQTKNIIGEEMKRLLVLVAVLALVAAMVVPMATFAAAPPTTAEVSIGGSVPAVASQYTFVPPGTINDSSWSLIDWNGGNALQVGLNYAKATNGSVTFVQGNDGATGYKVTAVIKPGWIDPSDSLAHMYDGNLALPTPIKLSFDGGSSFANYNSSDVVTWNGPANTALYLNAEQQVNTTDAAGVYYVYVVYTFTPQ